MALEEYFTLEEVDRAVYEALRLTLVSSGNLPDVTTMDDSQFEAAKTALGNNLIDLYGVSASGLVRGRKDVNRILIERERMRDGDIGGGTVVFKPVMDGDAVDYYEKAITPLATKAIRYSIRGIVNTTAYDRKVEELVMQAFKEQSYIFVVNPITGALDSSKFLNIRFMLSDRVIGGMGGNKDIEWKERVFIYQVEDVWLKSLTTNLGTVVPMTGVELTINLENSNGDVTDSITIE